MAIIEFQTLHTESNTRMNAALRSVRMELGKHLMTAVFDTTGYDSDELNDTISRHVDKGVQNIKIEMNGSSYAMVVEPVSTSSFETDQIVIRYGVIAYIKD